MLIKDNLEQVLKRRDK